MIVRVPLSPLCRQGWQPLQQCAASLTETGRSVRSRSFLDFRPAEADSRRPVVLNVTIRAGVPEQRSRQRAVLVVQARKPRGEPGSPEEVLLIKAKSCAQMAFAERFPMACPAALALLFVAFLT